jgi:hypothetical protein
MRSSVLMLSLFSFAAMAQEAAPAPSPQEEVAPAPPLEELPESSSGDHEFRDRHATLLGLGGATVALGAAGAIASWLDRDGTFGRVSAITVGTIGTAFLIAGISALIAYWVNAVPERNPTTAGEMVGEIVEKTFSMVAVGIVAIIAGLAGLAVGAVMSAFVSAPPGTQRGVLGLAGGGAMIAASIAVVAIAW